MSSTKRGIMGFSRRNRAVAAKKCTKKRDARAAELLFPIQAYRFFAVLVDVAVVVAKLPIRGPYETKTATATATGTSKKAIDYDQNNNSARTSRFFVNFVALSVYIKLRRGRKRFMFT